MDLQLRTSIWNQSQICDPSVAFGYLIRIPEMQTNFGTKAYRSSFGIRSSDSGCEFGSESVASRCAPVYVYEPSRRLVSSTQNIMVDRGLTLEVLPPPDRGGRSKIESYNVYSLLASHAGVIFSAAMHSWSIHSTIAQYKTRAFGMIKRCLIQINPLIWIDSMICLPRACVC